MSQRCLALLTCLLLASGCGRTEPFWPRAGLFDAGQDAGLLDPGPDGGQPVADAGVAAASCGPCLAVACLPSCGDGRCDPPESCGSCAVDCGVCRPLCDGSPGGWDGCRGNGCAVCAEKLVVFPRYIRNHPSCVRVDTCAGQFFLCNKCCPLPTDADR